ncbi:MAG: hypothetical protein IT446_15210 [Phycisphaerales bacterium]|nr:hypothetical protein [Phycisphaerales bacterium]
MSTPTAAKPSTGGYQVARPLGRCAISGREIAPDERFMAALRETAEGFERLDVSMEHWGELADKSDLLGYWQATMPRPEQKKKLFVDDEILCGLFERLSEAAEPSKLNFRFVLGLILMRKRLIQYDATRQEDGQEIWSVRLKGRTEPMDLLNPQLNEQQVMEVSQQLSEILSEEL